MNISPVWFICKEFSLIELAQLLAGFEPVTPVTVESDSKRIDLPPAAVVLLKEILRFMRQGRGFVHAFLDRYAFKPAPFHHGFFLDACDMILLHDAEIKPDFFDQFSVLRSEAMDIAEVLELRPAWLFDRHHGKISQKVKRHSQSMRERAREIAKEQWGRDTAETIKGLAEYIAETKGLGIRMKNGHKYEPSTVYDWIKDLAPNRNPGRRAVE